MAVKVDKTVRELALETPNATRVFEKFGIDYCCGGKRSLAEACSSAGLQASEVLKALEAEGSCPAESAPPDSLAGLAEYIVRKHHKFTREEIARLQALLAKVCSVHGTKHPELLTIQELFAGLSQELTMHLMKEENVLFPYIIRMEEAIRKHEGFRRPPFGTVQNPVRMMSQEHDGASEVLRKIRKESNTFNAPADACSSYRTLYEALQGFEADLHQHIHLENNVLFPRAIEVEESFRGVAS